MLKCHTLHLVIHTGWVISDSKDSFSTVCVYFLITVVPLTLLILFRNKKKNKSWQLVVDETIACQPKSLMWSLRCIISITSRSERSVFLWAWHAVFIPQLWDADYSFWWKRVWSVSGVDERWNEKWFSDISAWCLWVSEFEFQALLWFCHNKEVLISAGFSKQMCLCVRVCAWLRYECLSYWYCSVHICSL